MHIRTLSKYNQRHSIYVWIRASASKYQ